MSDERKLITGSDYEIDRQGRVFRVSAVNGVPKGFQKKPKLIAGRIIYHIPVLNFYRSVGNIILEFFGEKPQFAEDKDYFKWLRAQADEHNTELYAQRKSVRAVIKQTSRSAASKSPDKPVRPRLHGLSTVSGYCAAVGVKGAETSMADFCPLG